MSQQVELEPDQLERMQIVPGTDSVRQRWDDFAKCRQRLVDVCAFLESSAFSSGRVGALTPSQVH